MKPQYYKLLTNSPEDRLEAEKWIGKTVIGIDYDKFSIFFGALIGEKAIYLEGVASGAILASRVNFQVGEEDFFFPYIMVPDKQPEREYYDYFSREEARKYIGKEVELFHSEEAGWKKGVLQEIEDEIDCFYYKFEGYWIQAFFIRPIKKETRVIKWQSLLENSSTGECVQCRLVVNDNLSFLINKIYIEKSPQNIFSVELFSFDSKTTIYFHYLNLAKEYCFEVIKKEGVDVEVRE
jgi:hypothetical protein